MSVRPLHYLVVEMAKLATDQLRHEGLVGILPLLLLTRDGATHGVVDEVIAGLHEAKKYDLLPVTELLASLVLKDDDPTVLLSLIGRMAIAPTAEDAERILQDAIKGDEETH